MAAPNPPHLKGESHQHLQTPPHTVHTQGTAESAEIRERCIHMKLNVAGGWEAGVEERSDRMIAIAAAQ